MNRKTRPSKIKGPSVAKLKKKLWKIFSEYIRRNEADDLGRSSCVSCGKSAHWKQLQAGHFIPSRANSVLFDERGVHSQCPRCNLFLGGNFIPYERFMIQKYGVQVVEELKSNYFKVVKFSVGDLEAMIEKYKAKLHQIAK